MVITQFVIAKNINKSQVFMIISGDCGLLMMVRNSIQVIHFGDNLLFRKKIMSPRTYLRDGVNLENQEENALILVEKIH